MGDSFTYKPMSDRAPPTIDPTADDKMVNNTDVQSDISGIAPASKPNDGSDAMEVTNESTEVV